DIGGGMLLDALRAERVATSAVFRDRASRTGAAAARRSSPRPASGAPGAGGRLSIADIASAEDLIEGARALVVQPEVPLAPLTAAVLLAHTAGVHIVMDPAPPIDGLAALLPLVDVIRTSAREAEALTGVAVGDLRSARRAALDLLDRGAGAACVAAPGGDLAVWSDGEEWLPHHPVDRVDPSGADDAFVAALAVLLAEEWSVHEAAWFASAAAALACTRVGPRASLPRR